MAQQTINVGTAPNDGTGTPLRTAFQYTNSNFSELYTATGPSGNNITVPGTATITGDLTVDTNVLKVDTTNNRVGINTASPTAGMALDIVSATSNNFVRFTDGVNATGYLGVRAANGAVYLHANNNIVSLSCSTSNTTPTEQLRITNPGVFEFLDGAGGTRMTLNSTGLGVGNAPVAALDVYKVANDTINRTNATFCFGQITGLGAALLGQQSASAPYQFNLQAANAANSVQFPLVLQPSGGNVGIGVTPSAWAATFKPVQIGSGTVSSAFVGQTNSPVARIMTNSYFDGTNFVKVQNNTAGMYALQNNQHEWHNATTGTGTFSFTQAMTLDASGNLLVGTTTNGGNGVSIRPSTASPNVVLVGSDTSGGTAWQLYSTGTSSNRFYVTWAGVVNAVNTTISGISDARLKENVQDIDVGLGAILALKPRKFDWKAGKGKDIKGDRGFIAQEFEQVFPQLVDEWADPAPEGEAPYKSVRQDLIPVLVKAIQELTARVQTLETR